MKTAPPIPSPDDRRVAPRLRPALGTTCRFDAADNPAAPSLGLVWNISLTGVSMLVASQPKSGEILTGYPALRGRWQLKNASVALAALDVVADRLPVSLGEVKRGLTLVRLSGRLQALPGRPSVVLDVAHNPHAARALAQGLGEMGYYEATLAVFAMLADKDIAGVVDAMRGRIDRWFVSAADADRAAPAEAVAKVLAERGLASATRTFATVAAALAAARREAGPNDRIVVFGSFHTVAEALRSAS